MVLYQQHVVIMRGPPGCGKSTFAYEYVQKNFLFGTEICSTDDFFMVDGKYQFDPKMLQEHHDSNQRRVCKAIQRQRPFVIVDNTNSQFWEMKPYVELAQIYRCKVIFIEPDQFNPNWNDLDALITTNKKRKSLGKNIHVGILSNIVSRFEPNATVKDVLASSKPVWNGKTDRRLQFRGCRGR